MKKVFIKSFTVLMTIVSILTPLSVTVHAAGNDYYECNGTFFKTGFIRDTGKTSVSKNNTDFKINKHAISSTDLRIFENRESLPESYNISDYSDEYAGEANVVYAPPVRNQLNWGTCWAFSSLDSIASNLIKKAGGRRPGTDPIHLSERQMAWFAYMPYNEYFTTLTTGISHSQKNEGFFLTHTNNSVADTAIKKTSDLFMFGASEKDVNVIAQNRRGIASAEEIPYTDVYGNQDFSEDADWSVNDYDDYDTYHVSNFISLPCTYGFDNEGKYQMINNPLEVADTVKSFVKNTGAVAVCYCADQSLDNSGSTGAYFNFKHGAAYNNISSFPTSNHASLIVGWDDNYPKEFFANAACPEGAPGNGAFLVKNSWGTDWGMISYNNQSIYKLIRWEEGTKYKALGDKTIQEYIYNGGDIYFRKKTKNETSKTWEIVLCDDNGAPTRVITDIYICCSTERGDIISLYKDSEHSDDNFLGSGLKVSKDHSIYPNSPTWKGYFYLSYYDCSISSLASYEGVLKEDDYDNSYNYAYNKSDDAYTDLKTKIRVANVYTAKSNEILKAINTDILTPGTTISIDVYTFDEDLQVTNPEFGGTYIEEAHTEKQFPYVGTYTIPLNIEVPVSEGQSYAIVASFKHINSDGTIQYDVPIERSKFITYIYRKDLFKASITKANEGESFLFDPESARWYDVTDKDGILNIENPDNDVRKATYLNDPIFPNVTVGNVILSALTDDVKPTPEPTATPEPEPSPQPATPEPPLIKITPNISLTSKTTTFNGKPVAVEAASVTTGDNGEISYTYYTDSACTKLTTVQNGSQIPGSSPVNAGTYYVKATVNAYANYNSATSEPVMLTIKKAASGLKVGNLSKTYKASKLRKSALSFTTSTKVASDGKISYIFLKYNAKKTRRYMLLNKKTGKITMKKNAPKGTYMSKIKISVCKTLNYNASSLVKTLKVKVK